jgi:phage terminase large subunit-like protein
VKLAVKRHVEDLKRQGTEDFPYMFDSSLAQRPIDFIQQLSHTKGIWASTYGGRSNKIKLEDWQQFHIAEIFGWIHIRHGSVDSAAPISKSHERVARRQKCGNRKLCLFR